MAHRITHLLLSLPAIAFAAALLAPAAGLADGVEEPALPPVSAAPPPAPPRANEPGPCVGDAPIGQVVSVAGAAQALAPGQAPRTLACDDALRACEEITTAPGASLGFLSGDVLVRVGGDSRVLLHGSEGAPDVFVHQGTVRTTDGRPSGAAPVKLTTRDLAASASAADAELSTGAAAPSRLCTHAGSAAVEAGGRSQTLGAGQCLAAERGGVSTFAASGGPALGLEAPGFCAFDVALDDTLSPGDVAAPPGVLFPGGDPADDIGRDPCDRPGASCLAGDRDLFDDPDPEPGCDAPGVNCDPKDPKPKDPKPVKDEPKYPKYDKGGVDWIKGDKKKG